jgi:hypothetical protein
MVIGQESSEGIFEQIQKGFFFGGGGVKVV